jgi:ferredoxin
VTLRRRAVLQWGVRLALLAAALLLTLGGPLPDWLAARLAAVPWLGAERSAALLRAIPAASPLAWLAGTLAGRRLPAPLAWAALPALLLLLAVWRNRLFCNWLCPAGTLYALGAKAPLKKRRLLTVRLNGVLFWTILSASLLGMTALLAVDPLSTFLRLPALLRPAATWAAWIPGLLLPALLLLGAVQPLAWCTHLCPLGYSFDLTHAAVRRKGAAGLRVDRVRRELLAGVAIGAPLALLGRHWLGRRALRAAGAQGHAPAIPVLPPGAESPERFAALCSRCYACVQACPTQVLRVAPPRLAEPAAAFAPELRPYGDPFIAERGFCKEHCTRCTEVCPVGALRPLALAEKRDLQIGVAVIHREACIAWADQGFCMVCQEMCPYQAIAADILVLPDGTEVNRPVVNAAKCRGCGFCQSQCPAVRLGKAILVEGVPRQRPVVVAG